MGPYSEIGRLRAEGRRVCPIYRGSKGEDDLWKLAPSLAVEARAALLDDNRVRRVGPPLFSFPFRAQ